MNSFDPRADSQLPNPTPNPPPNPLPPIPIATLFDIARIVIFVTVWYITTDANNALSASVDYYKMAVPGSTLLGLSWAGAQIGLLQGLIISAKALVTIWAGPTLFNYLGPVLTSAFRTPINLLIEFRQAWLKPRKKDDNTPDDDHTDPKKDPHYR
ncbi:MAG: hypothetical protein K2X27_10180 [Candidatus Obscuribacterales bacterium]|nr:hypothetical protein [Candidatus Obscuribacterales bacterium]